MRDFLQIRTRNSLKPHSARCAFAVSVVTLHYRESVLIQNFLTKEIQVTEDTKDAQSAQRVFQDLEKTAQWFTGLAGFLKDWQGPL